MRRIRVCYLLICIALVLAETIQLTPPIPCLPRSGYYRPRHHVIARSRCRYDHTLAKQ
jgi:hypothetical protein